MQSCLTESSGELYGLRCMCIVRDKAVYFTVKKADLYSETFTNIHFTDYPLYNFAEQKNAAVIILERLKLPQQIIYYRKGKLSEGPKQFRYLENISFHIYTYAIKKENYQKRVKDFISTTFLIT